MIDLKVFALIISTDTLKIKICPKKINMVLYNCYFREGFIFTNFTSQNLVKISISNLCLHMYI